MSLTWSELLEIIPVLSVKDFLGRRLVQKSHLEGKNPPDYLFTSGNPGRFNPRGVFSIYASEDLPTAGAEFERYWRGGPEKHVLYFIEFSGLVIDLGHPKVLSLSGLSTKQLHLSWRCARTSTLCQQLGLAVSKQTRVAGIRFPSDAARERKFKGYNYVLFKNAVVTPSKVEVRDDAGVVVQTWP